MKFDSTLMTCVRADVENNLIPMLLGEPGIGKSSWLIKLAEDMHTEVFVLACNQLADKADLTGARLVPTDGGGYKQTFYPHAVIADAIAYAEANPRETPILFMDELNRTTPDVTSECLSIPTLRAIGSQKLPDNLRVVIAGNDKGNVTSLDEASVSRFVLYRVKPDVNTFLAVNPDLNEYVKQTLTAHPDLLFCKRLPPAAGDGDEAADSIEELFSDETDGMQQLTTPRTITAVSRWLNNFDDTSLQTMLTDVVVVDGEQSSVLEEALFGHIGNTAFAAQLLATIAQGVMVPKSGAPSDAAKPARPQCYDALKACASRSALDQFVTSMSDRERAGCLVYALWEPVDNADYIDALGNSLTQASMGSDAAILMQRILSGGCDKINLEAFQQSNCVLAQELDPVLGAVLGQ